jgi:hypothetical protein
MLAHSIIIDAIASVALLSTSATTLAVPEHATPLEASL